MSKGQPSLLQEQGDYKVSIDIADFREKLN